MKTKVIVKKQNLYYLPDVEILISQIFEDLKIKEKLKNCKTVLLKPNLLGAHHPDKAVTTHPVVLEAVIRNLLNFDKELMVGDSPGGTVKASQVWQETGIKEVCDKYNIRIIDFGKEGVISVQSKVTKLYFDKNIIECDAIINLAKMKTHSLMLYTGAVKNLYGTIPGLYKSELHKFFPNPRDFSEVLCSVYDIIKPKIVLNIIDGIIGMEGEGPSAGKPYPYGILIASEIASAADYLATKLMGFDFESIKYLNDSFLSDDLKEDDLEFEKEWKDFKFENLDIKTVIFRNKMLEKMPAFLKEIFKSIFSYYPAFLPECKLCMVCIQSCPVKALSVNNKKIILDKRRCIKCMCCHEMCPYSVIYLKKHMLAKIIFRNKKK